MVTLFAAAVLIRLSLEISWPDWWWFAGGYIAVFTLWFSRRLSPQYTAVLLAVLTALCVTSIRMDNLPQNIITRETYAEITGEIERIEYRPNRPTRLTLRVNTINKNIPILGARVQLYVRTKTPKNMLAGDIVHTSVVFDTMNGPIVPGGFDFAQYSLLNGISAQGFAVAPIKLASAQNNTHSITTRIENIRTNISAEIIQHMEPVYAGIAVSLITGQRQYLDKETNDSLRETGLSHLLAISGLHMGLLTAAAFALFELIFAAIPAIALRVLPKKIAGVAAWIFACCYLVISGGSTATVRAFIMVSVAILAILTDRRVVSLRSVALAAFAVLLIDPAAILSVSFHMSFAATTALVVVFELVDSIKRKGTAENKQAKPHSFMKKMILYALATAATTLVAQLAVAPFALYHFQSLSLVGLLTNIVAIPIMAFVVMPAAFLSLAAMLIGLDPIFLSIMEQGLRIIMSAAELVQSIPGGTLNSLPYGKALLPITGICIAASCILGGRKGLALWSLSIPAAIASCIQEPADILVDGTGNIIAQHLPQSKTIQITGGRRNGFRDEAWLRYWGLGPNGQTQKIPKTCDTRACLIKLTQHPQSTSIPDIIRSNSLEVTRKACSEGAIVIASYRHRNYCKGAHIFLAQEDIDRYGPVGLWLQKTSKAAPLNLSKIIKLEWSIPFTHHSVEN